MEGMVARGKNETESSPCCGSLLLFYPSLPCPLVPFVVLLCFFCHHLHLLAHHCAIFVRLNLFHDACSKEQHKGGKDLTARLGAVSAAAQINLLYIIRYKPLNISR